MPASQHTCADPPVVRGPLQCRRPGWPHGAVRARRGLDRPAGRLAKGIEQARAALQGFLALKGRITLDTKLVVTVGELAYLANTWSLTGTGPDGDPVVLGATAEGARRQADGSWRYVIDNAWGDQAVGGSP